MKIIVTQEDINNGKAASLLHCPIALAAQRAGIVYPRVAPTYLAYGSVTNTRILKTLPVVARRFVEAFDTGEKVEPFEFELSD